MKKSELLLNPYKEHLKKPYLHGAGILEINGVQYSADEYITMLEEENVRLVKNLAEYKNEITDLKEENRKLKLHIEAKDKAYTALLKDYEELKEDRDKMKKRVKEHIIYSVKAEFIKKFGE